MRDRKEIEQQLWAIFNGCHESTNMEGETVFPKDVDPDDYPEAVAELALEVLLDIRDLLQNPPRGPH